MADDENKGIDLLGIKPISDSINTVSKGVVEGASAFLSRICLPAAEEFGLLLRDKVSNWRINNYIKTVQKAEKKYEKFAFDKSHAHPRLVSSILDNSSWVDSENIQEMWAGLLTSSCSDSGDDDSNLIFINILSQITSLQAKVINHACEKVGKKLSTNRLVVPDSPLVIKMDELFLIAGISDCHRLDRELDHLRYLGVMRGGIHTDSEFVDLTPTELGLQMYVRCQGSNESPIIFFKLESE